MHCMFAGLTRGLPTGVQKSEPNMYLVVLGVLLIVMKWAEFGPVAEWSWWWVLDKN